MLLRSAGRVALIDTGPDPAPLHACLSALGVDRIDLLIITHFDLDHFGGTDAVIGRVGVVLHGPVGAESDRRLLEQLAASGAQVVEGFAGQHGTLGGAGWQVLWPQRDTRGFEVGNDTSLVLEFGGGGLPRTLLLGDLGASSQRQLLGGGRVRGPYAIVKIAHHGSRDQEPALYAEARPAVALFTVGENTYGHPHPDALAMVDGAHILRTDLQGRVLLRAEEDALTLWAERPAG
ncbi:MBL fold metallo-hydrolase (plasmid) [Microbacterium sp. NIBRBAC000506063]|nr:MBL fold metallo-hydrolase [Microbacterium sp. NIBRBAC000506063]